MKIFLATLLTICLTGCDYAERNNTAFLKAYKAECASRGYNSINVKYIGGLVSSYYTCFNK